MSATCEYLVEEATGDHTSKAPRELPRSLNRLYQSGLPQSSHRKLEDGIHKVPGEMRMIESIQRFFRP